MKRQMLWLAVLALAACANAPGKSTTAKAPPEVNTHITLVSPNSGVKVEFNLPGIGWRVVSEDKGQILDSSGLIGLAVVQHHQEGRESVQMAAIRLRAASVRCPRMGVVKADPVFVGARFAGALMSTVDNNNKPHAFAFAITQPDNVIGFWLGAIVVGPPSQAARVKAAVSMAMGTIVMRKAVSK